MQFSKKVFYWNSLRHTGENIKDLVDKDLDKFRILEERKFDVTDNASNCKAAFQGERLGCFAHTLHLIVKVGLKVDGVRDLVACLRWMSTFFKSSGLAHLDLKDNEQWLGFPNLNVLGEVPTHWGSFLHTGKRYL